MSGTLDGGRKAAITNKKKYGEDFYAKIGRIGGSLGTTGGFYADRDLARSAGMKGGRKSRRGPAQSKPIYTTNFGNKDSFSNYEKLESEPRIRHQ